MNVSEKPRDIEKRTFDFGVRIIKLCRFLEGKSWVNSTLGRQIPRCGTSIGSNVEEAQAAESRADFISKNNISLKDARETRYRSGCSPLLGSYRNRVCGQSWKKRWNLNACLEPSSFQRREIPTPKQFDEMQTFSFFRFPFSF